MILGLKWYRNVGGIVGGIKVLIILKI